jgi:hypothetical protein
MSNFKKVISNIEAEIFFDVKNYETQTKAQCDDIVVQIKNKHEQEVADKIEAEILKYKKINDAKINDYLQALTTTVLQRVGSYLQDIFDQNFDCHYIKKIVLQEINQGFMNHELIIYANELTLEHLKQELAEVNKQLTFVVDAELAPNTCICENQFYKLLINPTEIKNKIQQIFVTPNLI